MNPIRDASKTPSPVPHGGPAGAADEGRPPVRLDFSVNVNAWGPAKVAADAARAADIAAYPDPDALLPRRAVATVWGLPVDRILFSSGASELVHRVGRALLAAGDAVLVAAPTFGEYARASALAGARVQEVRGAPPRFHVPVAEFVRALKTVRPRLVFVCSPNNPTGEELDLEALRAIADALPRDGTLVLDESYRSFARLDFAPPALGARDDVLYVRSLTKDCALAALRAGFAVGAPEVLQRLRRFEAPWSSSAPAQAAAAAALSPSGLAHLGESVRRLAEERPRLAEALTDLGWEPVPSTTNFLLARVHRATVVATRLRQLGIRVRHCGTFGLPGHLRLAVRRPAENEELIGVVESLRA